MGHRCKVVTIRLARPEDVPALARLRVAMDADEGVAAEESFVGSFEAWCSTNIQLFTVFVAEAAGAVVGTLWLERVERVPRPSHDDGPLGYVTNCYVAQDHRNAGVGRSLLDAVVEHANAAGFSMLIASPSERAEPLWRRAGFGQTDFLELALPRHDAGGEGGPG